MEIKNLSRNEKGTVSFVFQAGEEEYRPFLEAASKALQEDSPVDGYRKGKAPLDIAKKFYGERLFQKANDEALYYFYVEACDDNGFSPVSPPMINILRNDLDGMSVMCSFYDYPAVSDLKYRGLEVEKPVKTCSEEDIDQDIDTYMKNHMYVHEVDKGAEPGDIIEVAFTARATNGTEFPYDHSDNLRYVLGDDTLFTGLDVLLEGHKKGDVIEATLELPGDFHRKESAGLTVETKVTLRGVWQRDILPCTDEYVKEHIDGCETVGDFREKRREALQKSYDEMSERLFDNNLRHALASEVNCVIPKTMVEVQLKNVENGLKQYAEANGTTVEEMLQAEGKTLEQVLDESYAGCEEDVKVSVALDYISRAEDLKVSEAELNRRLEKYASQRGITLGELSKKNNFFDFQEKACEEILNEKAEQTVRENLIVTEREYSELPSPF